VDFSFGRSLNYGCEAATGDALVIVSGHCIPTGNHWIRDLISPLGNHGIAYVYGGQIGDQTSHFSERRIFSKYFPQEDHLPQEGFYCNNANAVLLKSVWLQFKFDEELTGLEDMHLAKRLLTNGMRIGYVAKANVYHLHNETWEQIRRRFEREAIALQHIMPEVHLSFIDVLRYFVRAVVRDLLSAYEQDCLYKDTRNIFIYRFMQFLGSYRGNNTHRKLSRANKELYFYPNRKAQHQASTKYQTKEKV
jgi:GT2 family glycosyltransferase